MCVCERVGIAFVYLPSTTAEMHFRCFLVRFLAPITRALPPRQGYRAHSQGPCHRGELTCASSRSTRDSAGRLSRLGLAFKFSKQKAISPDFGFSVGDACIFPFFAGMRWKRYARGGTHPVHSKVTPFGLVSISRYGADIGSGMLLSPALAVSSAARQSCGVAMPTFPPSQHCAQHSETHHSEHAESMERCTRNAPRTNASQQFISIYRRF